MLLILKLANIGEFFALSSVLYAVELSLLSNPIKHNIYYHDFIYDIYDYDNVIGKLNIWLNISTKRH